MEELTKLVKDIPGFKISNTHFRIGSKIHISEFYYAKRFFQNSYYASRIAYLVAKELKKVHSERLNEIVRDGITLIGYGLYSELLLSLVVKFLRKTLNSSLVNHDLITDIEEPRFIKKYELIYKTVTIIVPIASTFSTSIKMEETIRRNYPDSNILEPYINVLYVCDHDGGDKNGKNSISEIEKRYGWVENDSERKTIAISALLLGSEGEGNPVVRRQKYLLLLPSRWNDIDNCPICYPSKAIDERPLFYTDKTSVTPILIFGFPEARNIEYPALAKKYRLEPDSLNYGHWERGEYHYHYYINIERFFENNKAEVEIWLKEISNSESFHNIYSDEDRIVIVAPGHYSNAGFINLVNETLFSNAANIIHYEPRKDYVQNFKLFYGRELDQDDIKIFFVDDTITSGGTFRRLNRFVQGARKNGYGVEGIIVLLDRSSRYVHDSIRQELHRSEIYDEVQFYSFANINLPALKEVGGECSLCIELKRYRELVSHSFLDRTKAHFLGQEYKLRERKIRDLNRRGGGNISRDSDCVERYTSRIEAIHRIHEWFGKDPISWDVISFDIWRERLIKETKGPFTRELLRPRDVENESLSNETATIFKVLTQPPLIHYQPLRKRTFEWILQKLTEQVAKIHLEMKKGVKEKGGSYLKYEWIKDLKFLTRRAGLLNANYLISKEYISLINGIYGELGIPKLESQLRSKLNELGGVAEETVVENESVEEDSKKRGDEKRQRELILDGTDEEKLRLALKEKRRIETELDNLCDFNVFYVAQVKELLFLNDARSVKLEEVLEDFETKNTVEPELKQIFRVLREENGNLYESYWDYLLKLNILGDVNLTSEESENEIREILARQAKINHYKYETLSAFFRQTGQGDPKSCEAFISFLWLKIFFLKEKENLTATLAEKTSYVMEKLKSIFLGKDADDRKCGAFFVVNINESARSAHEIKRRYFFAYNTGPLGGVEEKEIDRDKGAVTIRAFLSGVGIHGKIVTGTEVSKSIIEYQRKDNGEWVDLYAVNGKVAVSDLDKFVGVNGCNRLLLLRLNRMSMIIDAGDKKKIVDEPKGLIGFYYSCDGAGARSVNATRYLLLLRESLNSFIENHHENDEFRDWVEADRRKNMTLLTGHGREMLMNIAAANPEPYKTIVLTILMTQRLLTDFDDEERYRGTSSALRNYARNHFRYYYGSGNLMVDDTYLEELLEIADKVYSFPEIENSEECEVGLRGDYKNIKFKFPRIILDMIGFELFVNSKKNRWIFVENESIHDEGSGQKYETNHVTIDVNMVDKKLQLSITNTGPKVTEATIYGLNQVRNIKGYTSAGGIALIKRLLKDFELGAIEFSQHEIKNKFCLFTVTLMLVPWDDER